MSTARLRRTSKYPPNDSDEDDTGVLDEEEQEKLILELRKEDNKQIELFKRIFLAITLSSAATFLPALFTSRILQAKLICLLSISSLLYTAYILKLIPKARPESVPRKQARLIFQPKVGPVRQYLGYLNGGLTMLIALNALSLKGKKSVHEGFWLLCILPAAVFSLTVIAKRNMEATDISELEDLRYELKGA